MCPIKRTFLLPPKNGVQRFGLCFAVCVPAARRGPHGTRSHRDRKGKGKEEREKAREKGSRYRREKTGEPRNRGTGNIKNKKRKAPEEAFHFAAIFPLLVFFCVLLFSRRIRAIPSNPGQPSAAGAAVSPEYRYSSCGSRRACTRSGYPYTGRPE